MLGSKDPFSSAKPSSFVVSSSVRTKAHSTGYRKIHQYKDLGAFENTTTILSFEKRKGIYLSY